MRLTEPNQIYPQLWKALTGEKAAIEQARNLLEKRFSSDHTEINERSSNKKTISSKRKTIVLLVDELDMLWNRKQSVLYNIFEWPVNKSAKLVVLAIANTMDLPVSRLRLVLAILGRILVDDLGPLITKRNATLLKCECYFLNRANYFLILGKSNDKSGFI